MEVVVVIVEGLELFGVCGIVQYGIEIDYIIEFGSVVDLGVDFLLGGFVLGGISFGCCCEWQYSICIDLYIVCVGCGEDGFVGGDDWGCQCVGCGGGFIVSMCCYGGQFDVIDFFKQQ